MVWLKGATGEEARAVSIVVVNFDPRDRNDGDEVKAGAVQVDVAQGNLTAAHRRWTEALDLYRRLKMPAQIADVTSSLAALTALEPALAAWKTHPALLAQGGVLVIGITPNSQAEQIPLHPGDILLRYNHTPLDKPATLIPLAKATPPTHPVTLEILRGPHKLTLKAHGGLLGIALADLPPKPKP